MTPDAVCERGRHSDVFQIGENIVNGVNVEFSKGTMGSENKPFLLKPVGKDYLWGGRRLRDDFAKDLEMDPLAESWECSTHPDGTSIVDSGSHKGKTLREVIAAHPEYLGSHPVSYAEKGMLPILVKFIDAKKDLSVQVHPSDSYAFTHENGQLGKTEMWYVVDAEKDAHLVYGFRWNMTRELLGDSLKTGSVQKYLQRISVKKGDVFFIEPGTVHAIGAGVVIAEIQENSNLTYRLFDYNRRDKNGNLRKLHIDKALDVINYNSSAEPVQPLRVLKYSPGYASEMLARCKYFQVERVLINTARTRDMAGFKTLGNSFAVLLCIDGCGNMFGEDTLINFFKGDCIFVPAGSAPLRLHGKAELLKITC